MEQQFFGHIFKKSLLVSLVLYVAAVFLFQSNFALYALILIAIGVGLISLKKLEYGLYLAFLELFITSHGHLITSEVSGYPFSLRIAVFLGVLGAWGILFLRRKVKIDLQDRRLVWHLPLFIAIVIGVFSGLTLNDVGSAINDANGYFYILYVLPILSVSWNQERKGELLQVLAAGAVWTVIVTYLLLYIFSHFGTSILSVVYTFVRDSRVAEVTRMVGDFHRVFLQSQFFVIVFGFLLGSQYLMGQKFKSFWLDAVVFGSVIAVFALSLSRSFWVGAIVGIAGFLLFALRTQKLSKKQWMHFAGKHVIGLVSAAVLVVAIVLVPIPANKIDSGALSELFKTRTRELNDAGVSSRWKLLTPMLDLVKERPVLGSGFGKTVTFENDDPRARSISPDGTWTTYAMEWGWIELWLKMGILGPIAFLYLFVQLFKRLTYYFWTEQSWIGLGLISSLAFLYATHVFSPYLNHPIGLGFLLFILPFISNTTKQKVTVESLINKTKTASTPAVAASHQPTD